MEITETTKDKILAAMLGALASAMVGFAFEAAQNVSVPTNIFYMESHRPHLAENVPYSSIITIVNPSSRDIAGLSISIRSKAGKAVRIAEHFGDGDFGPASPPMIFLRLGGVLAQFEELPKEARYTMIIESEGLFDIGTSLERVRATSKSGSVRITKLKREYFRYSMYENYYFLIFGMLAGPLGVLAYWRIKSRRKRREGN